MQVSLQIWEELFQICSIFLMQVLIYVKNFSKLIARKE